MIKSYDDRRLLPYADRFFPAWEDGQKRIRAITVETSPHNISQLIKNFHWFIREENDPIVSNLVLIKEFETTHSHTCLEDTMSDFFKPTLGEVFLQLPEDVKNREGFFYFTTSQLGQPNYRAESVRAITKVYQVAIQ